MENASTENASTDFYKSARVENISTENASIAVRVSARVESASACIIFLVLLY